MARLVVSRRVRRGPMHKVVPAVERERESCQFHIQRLVMVFSGRYGAYLRPIASLCDAMAYPRFALCVVFSSSGVLKVTNYLFLLPAGCHLYSRF